LPYEISRFTRFALHFPYNSNRGRSLAYLIIVKGVICHRVDSFAAELELYNSSGEADSEVFKINPDKTFSKVLP
jgi:hypothetical protein